MAATIVPESTHSLAPSRAQRAERLLYLDNIRLFLIAGVILAHAATHYIGQGAWISHEVTVAKVLIVVIGAVGLIGGLFWVGLFFLVAGLLAPGALARHGPRDFVRDRLIRLGIPLLIFMGLLMPLLDYGAYVVSRPGNQAHDSLWTFLRNHLRDPDSAAIWFVAVLLLFSVLYAGWWHVRPAHVPDTGPLRLRNLVALTAAISIPSFFLHLVFPLYSRQFMDLHFSQWPQYLVLFWFGTVSAQNRWLHALPDRMWRQCGLFSVAAILTIPSVAIAAGALDGHTSALTGGWHWEAMATTVVEGALAVFGSLWVLEFFRRYFDRQRRLVRQLARSAYAAYLFHVPLLVALALALIPLGLPLEVNLLILAPTLLLASFGLAWLIVIRFRVASQIL